DVIVPGDPPVVVGDHDQRAARKVQVLPFPEATVEAGTLLALGLAEDVEHRRPERLEVGGAGVAHVPPGRAFFGRRAHVACVSRPRDGTSITGWRKRSSGGPSRSSSTSTSATPR